MFSFVSPSSSSDEAIRPGVLFSLKRWTAHCQMWAVESPLAVSTSSLFGWNLMEFTEPVWPLYCSRGLPEFMPQTMAVWSAEAVPMRGRPMRETETSQTPSLWPTNRRCGAVQLIAGGPLRLDMILLVCWRSLLVWDRILWAYIPFDMPFGRLAAIVFINDAIEADDGVGVNVGSRCSELGRTWLRFCCCRGCCCWLCCCCARCCKCCWCCRSCSELKESTRSCSPTFSTYNISNSFSICTKSSYSLTRRAGGMAEPEGVIGVTGGPLCPEVS